METPTEFRNTTPLDHLESCLQGLEQAVCAIQVVRTSLDCKANESRLVTDSSIHAHQCNQTLNYAAQELDATMSVLSQLREAVVPKWEAIKYPTNS